MLGRLPSLEAKERPSINSAFIRSAQTGGELRNFNLDTLWWWIKRTPECIGILKRITTDIFTHAEFTAIDVSRAGRPSKNPNQKREEFAKRFWSRNHGRQKLIAGGYDWLGTGDAYLWKGKLSENQIKEVALRHYQSFGLEMKSVDVKQFFDEDFNGVNAIEIIPSSMTEIDHNDTNIVKYIQKSKVNPGILKEFSVDEVIHLKFIEMDGRVYGFSPMESSFVSILTVNAIQDYNYNIFANGVKMDRVWKFSGKPSQIYLDKFEENLAKYKKVKHAHGDLVVAGAERIESERLNEVTEEMEYRKLAINAVGRLAFAYNMPADILSSILGIDVKGTALGSDIEDAGYNRNIAQSQLYWEELLNSQLFIPEFKVMIKFERTFRQDQIRQVQQQVQASTFAEFLFKHDYPVTDEYIHEMLQIPRRFITSGKIERQPEPTPFEMPKAPLKPPEKGAAQQANSAAKTEQQKPQQNINPPTGG